MPPNTPVARPIITLARNTFLAFLNVLLPLVPIFKLFTSTLANPKTPVIENANRTRETDEYTKSRTVLFSSKVGW